MVENTRVDQIFKDYDAMIGGDVILHPFREEIVGLEKEGFKVGRVANLFSLLYIKVVGSDPEGVPLLRKMQQIPMVEVLGSNKEQTGRITILLRNVNEEKAVVSIIDGEVATSGETWEKNPEFCYVISLLFSKNGLFPLDKSRNL